MSYLSRNARVGLFALAAAWALATPAVGLARGTGTAREAPVAQRISDAALVASLPGFRQGFADVNGVRLHYVIGGEGEAVVLLPGWPETWWSYHKVMPALARNYRVIAVDIRGMGASSKPLDGYDKKNMARDIHELLVKLGYDKAHIVGHDIGAQVAWSFAANYPEATRTLTMLDVPHPDEGLLKWPLLPAHGTFHDKIDENHAYAWWFAFHQVKGLPEQMLEGRAQIEQAWFFRYLLKNESAIDARDRAVYAAAYNQKGGVRAGNAWYQAFTQDIIDEKTYRMLKMPVLGIAGPGYGWLNSVLTVRAQNPKVYKLPDSGHFIAEEQPEEMLSYLLPFLKQDTVAR